jgi:hypothetical protein
MSKKKLTLLTTVALASLALLPAAKVNAADSAQATTTSTALATAASTPQATDTAAKAQVVPTQAVGRINYSGRGKVALWSDYQKPHTIVGYVANNTAWKVNATAVLPDGHVMYSLGHNQWVPAEYLQLTSNQSVSNTNSTSKSTADKPASPADNGFKVQNVSGTVVVTYNGRGKVALWDNYASPRHTTGNYVANASRWQASAIATNAKGEKWYKLGRQWLSAEYGYMVNENVLVNGNQAAAKPAQKPAVKHGNFTIKDQTGTVVVAYHGKDGAPVYSSYSGKRLVRRVANNSRLAATQVAQDKNGKKWFKIGDNEWLSDDNGYMQWNTIDQTAKSGQHGTLRVAYSGRGKVAIWSGYGQGRKIVKYLPKNSYWKYFDAAKDQNGNNWYNLGGNQWISGEYVAL